MVGDFGGMTGGGAPAANFNFQSKQREGQTKPASPKKEKKVEKVEEKIISEPTRWPDLEEDKIEAKKETDQKELAKHAMADPEIQ